MTQEQNAPASTDALLARYHAAQAALNATEVSGPSAQTRASILNYAATVATDSVAARAINQRASGLLNTQKPSANDSQWKIRALATVAVFGLTSLLLLQWDRGTPQEKEVAFSTARPSGVAPPAPATKAQSYGAAQSARRDDAPEATGRLKKSESADDKSSMADASTAPAGRAASPTVALFAAIRSADTAAVQQALASGADKNAMSNGTPAITLCVQSGRLNLVQLLAAAGADVNAPDAQGITPLAHARARGFDAIATTLVSLGAN